MNDEDLMVNLKHLDGSAVLAVRGELDLLSAPVLREAVERSQSLGVPVVLDLAAVTFIDSSGLRVLIEASRRVGESPSLCVRNASPRVRRILELTAMESLMCENAVCH